MEDSRSQLLDLGQTLPRAAAPSIGDIARDRKDLGSVQHNRERHDRSR